MSKCENRILTAYGTKLCRCEVSLHSVAMASNRNAGEKKEGLGSVMTAHCINQQAIRAAEFRALYCNSQAKQDMCRNVTDVSMRDNEPGTKYTRAVAAIPWGRMQKKKKIQEGRNEEKQ
ncbi:hypothetical protein EVAR_90037_1 [Eumeta japonica]|uniref:Uncharacterized protein n=1 Tax=Eumeta variegata TaxID=151549 RepID=A0A4C1WV32_EUMVA|nr:hypothetical protein EVAR_90037_1 [Eumeta japonica]